MDAVAGWGLKKSARAAQRLANRLGKPYVALEDGFLRSVGLGVTGAPPLALVIDDLGIYYNAEVPSRLERYIACGAQPPEMLADASRAMRLIRTHRLSKYNNAPPSEPFGFSGIARTRVLVVDQTFGDMSVTLGSATASDFESMLRTARAENPNAEIWIKIHPDVHSSRKKGYLSDIAMGDSGSVFADDRCAISLLEQFDHVYVVTSQVGFEALVLGKKVTVFGRPWYAGWGLTDDRHPRMRELSERRPSPRTLEQLFAGAYLQYSRYIKPATGEPGTIFDVIDWLARNKAINDQSRYTFVCVGMSLWKRTIVKPFLATPSSRVRFVKELSVDELRLLPNDVRVVVWGN